MQPLIRTEDKPLWPARLLSMAELAGWVLAGLAAARLVWLAITPAGPLGTPPVALPQIRAGTLKALSLSTRLPSPAIPDELGSEAAGLPALDITGWWGVWTAARLPTPIRDRLFTAFRAVLAQQPVQARLAQEGLQALTSESPEAFGRFVQAELPIWAEIVKDAGATAD